MQSSITHFVLVFKKDLKANLSSGDLQIIFVVADIVEYVNRLSIRVSLNGIECVSYISVKFICLKIKCLD